MTKIIETDVSESGPIHVTAEAQLLELLVGGKAACRIISGCLMAPMQVDVHGDGDLQRGEVTEILCEAKPVYHLNAHAACIVTVPGVSLMPGAVLKGRRELRITNEQIAAYSR